MTDPEKQPAGAAAAGAFWDEAPRAPSLHLPLVFEAGERVRVLPEQMDELWNAGWRHFGRSFFRYSYGLGADQIQRVQPIRVPLATLTFSARHRRILRRNADLVVAFGPPELDAERHALFARHRLRFQRAVPDALTDFLGPSLADYPCPLVEVTARLAGRLVAASYLDLGVAGASSVYAMFEPAEARRSLGVATLLWEIGRARAQGCAHYHPGYAFHEPSAMDYKKQFSGSEWFDWRGRWWPLAR
jgi:arginine-tRNA-protein transferase